MHVNPEFYYVVNKNTVSIITPVKKKLKKQAISYLYFDFRETPFREAKRRTLYRTTTQIVCDNVKVKYS